MYVLLTLGACALGMVAKIVGIGHHCHRLLRLVHDPLESFQRSLDDSGFLSTLRVCLFSYHAMCTLVRTLWLRLAKLARMHGIAVIVLDMHAILLSVHVYFSLARRFCTIVLQDILNKLATHHKWSPRIRGYCEGEDRAKDALHLLAGQHRKKYTL